MTTETPADELETYCNYCRKETLSLEGDCIHCNLSKPPPDPTPASDIERREIPLDEWVDKNARKLAEDISVHILELGGLTSSNEEAALLRCIMTSVRQFTHSAAKEEVEGLRESLEAALNRITRTMAHWHESKERITALEAENAELEASYFKASESQRSLALECGQLHEEVDAIEAENSKFRDEASHYLAQFKNAERELDALKRENANLRESCIDLKRCHSEKSAMVRSLKTAQKELVESASDWVRECEEECNHQPTWQHLSKLLTKLSKESGV